MYRIVLEMLAIIGIFFGFDFVNSQSTRLNGGAYYEGRVEVYYYTTSCNIWGSCSYNWQWGTVCDDSFSTAEGRVACRSVGFNDVVSVTSYFGGGGGPIWLDDLGCSGSESYLWHCYFPSWGGNDCSHGEDIGVVCDIDECATGPCHNGGACTDGIASYTCSCTTGFYGSVCQFIDECASNPCQYNGACTDGSSMYTCACVPGITGVNCETNINECASSPCQNGGTCVDDINQYTCECTSAWEGTHCEIEIDECLSNPCQNGGTCTDYVDRYECACTAWYYSTECQLLDTSLTISQLVKYDNNILMNHVFSNVYARSILECLLKCKEHTACLSMNYQKSSGNCELNTSTKSDSPLDYVSSRGRVYFE
ncbi:uncharacterized protein [Antedon mediterranea]|uniref:uncharacterized protein n=1 Tax=Antedon mediterranea TaxID=105859 RepID=UPI003AF7D5E3